MKHMYMFFSDLSFSISVCEKMLSYNAFKDITKTAKRMEPVIRNPKHFGIYVLIQIVNFFVFRNVMKVNLKQALC